MQIQHVPVRPSPTWTENQNLLLQVVDIKEYKDASSYESRIRVFGVTDAGNSICLGITDFHPYLYLKLDQVPNHNALVALTEAISSLIPSPEWQSSNFISTELVMRRSCTAGPAAPGEPELSPFLKIHLKTSYHRKELSKLLMNNGVTTSFTGFIGGTDDCVYESDFDMVSQFEIATEMGSFYWIELDGFTCRRVYSKTTRCQIEVTASYKSIRVHDPEDIQWSTFAPIRVLSFDIEATALSAYDKGAHAIQICSCLTDINNGLIETTAYSLGGVDLGQSIAKRNIELDKLKEEVASGTLSPGDLKKKQTRITELSSLLHALSLVTVREFGPDDIASASEDEITDGEMTMIRAWADYIREVDPDIITVCSRTPSSQNQRIRIQCKALSCSCIRCNRVPNFPWCTPWCCLFGQRHGRWSPMGVIHNKRTAD
jgi:DNA polymerase elongation subunit (family B)